MKSAYQIRVISEGRSEVWYKGVVAFLSISVPAYCAYRDLLFSSRSLHKQILAQDETSSN
jgi:hypothetical protein